MVKHEDIQLLQQVTDKKFGKDWYTFFTDMQLELIYEAGSIEKHLDNSYEFFKEKDNIEDAHDMLVFVKRKWVHYNN